MRRLGLIAAAVFTAAQAAGPAMTVKDYDQAASDAHVAWQGKQQAEGWVGLQDAVQTCFADAKTARKVAYCVALDHFTELDTRQFPRDLIPPFFAASAVQARRQKAEAGVMADRASFDSHLRMAMEKAARAGGRR